MKNIPYVPEDFFGEESDLRALSKIALAWAKQHLLGKTIQHPVLGDIVIVKEGLRHTLYKDYNAPALKERNFAQVLATAALEKMIEKGTALPPERDYRKRDNVEAAHFLKSRVRVGENTYDVIIVVREVRVDRSGTRKHFYDHAVIL